MIIGRGLIATAFAKEFAEEGEITIFASGVSNSSETHNDAFAREVTCLTEAMENSKGLFVYFSTCSIGDHEQQQSPYVQHKIRMEVMVAKLPNYIIFRLPQVVGRTTNPHTLTNFIHTQILQGTRFPLWRNAWRNIIDVDDIVNIAGYMIRDSNSRYVNQTINIASLFPVSALNLVEIFEQLMHKKAHYDLIDRGDLYNIDVECALGVASNLGIDLSSGYVERVIEKYYGNTNEPS